MDNSNKIKSLSKKLATSLIKNESSGDLEISEVFNTKTKTQILMDIKDGERLNLLKQIDTKKDWKSVKRKIQRSKKPFRLWPYGIAASIVLLISITFIFNKTDQETNFAAPIIVNNTIEIGTDKAILTLEDGSEVALEKASPYQTDYVKSNGEKIIYKESNTKAKTIAYNTLTIPRGCQFYIVLSDGTKVWLNSESQLKYPVSFATGETRQIELVYGEAYFDVSPSTAHPPAGQAGKGSKFKVFHKYQEVEVLGTVFNIKAYKGETNIYTTLVEGKVAVSSASIKQNLMPNQQLKLNLKSNKTEIKTVEISNIISWKDGVFNFENKSLKDIMKVLSRWYDMDVVFINKALEEEKFIGSFNKNRPIEDVLLSIKSTNIINNYEINNKIITIK